MYKIVPTVQTTRRLRLNYVFDEADALLYSSADFGACLDWCYDQGHHRVLVEYDGQTWAEILIQRRSESLENE